jgi:metal-dependent amidase/aminoacylase/carboxypeptidase family protein
VPFRRTECRNAARRWAVEPDDLEQEIRQRAAAIENKLIAWRRDIHEHPELGEQETRTAALVAAHLTSLGLGLRIKITGQQGHAGFPWRAIDPITTASQIVLGLQTIVSRRTDLMKSPAVVSISTINGGSAGNIIADSVVMTGTIRTYDQEVRKGIHRDIRQIAENIAVSANAKAEVGILEMYEPTVNDGRVTARMVPVLERAADGDAIFSALSGAADDVSVFLAQVPGLYFNLGIVPRSQDVSKAAPNHSPDFFIDESALVVGVRALAMVTVNYLAAVSD